MVSGGFDGTIRITDLESQTQEILGEHNGVVNKVIIADPSGANIPMIISGGSDNLIKIWSLEGLKDTLEYHENSVSAMFSIDYYLITASYDKTVRMWNWMNTMKTKKVYTHHTNISAIAADTNGYFYYTSDESIIRQKANDPRDQKICKDFEGKVTCIAIDETSNVLAVGSRDRMVRTFSIPELKMITIFVDHESFVTGVSLFNGFLVSADNSGNMILYDSNSVLNRHSIDLPIISIQISADYISCTVSSHINLFTHSFEPVSSIEITNAPLSHCFTNYPDYMFVANKDAVVIHSVPNLAEIASFPAAYQVTSLSILPSVS